MSASAVNIFLVPCDPERYETSVANGIAVAEYPDHPEDLDDSDTVRVWGIEPTDNHRTYFEKMNPGDIVIFYSDDAYIGTGEIGVTFEDTDAWASTSFWDDEPWTLVFTIENFEPISIPKAAINEIFDYSTGYTPRGLTRIADNRVTNQPQAIKRALSKYTLAHPS